MCRGCIENLFSKIDDLKNSYAIIITNENSNHTHLYIFHLLEAINFKSPPMP